MNVIFDVDDTIYNLMEPFQRTHEEMYAHRTDADCEQLFRASREYSDEAFYMEERGELTAEEAFYYRIQKTYADVGIEVSGEEAKFFQQRYRYYQKHIHVPQAIKEVLTYCKESGITMGTLTNGKKENQGQKIATLDLRRWFKEESLLISGGLGYSKPDPKAFEAVEKELGLEKEATWFVGDAFDMDVIGAKKAGWHVIWFNHRHRAMPECDIRPDVEVDTPEALLETIKKLAEANS